ncbi:MAG: hypothetical protein LC792_00790 [Actinobacteria bacterium]|nr:hypothetical protein [Actinomycetota bacterium]
MTRLHRLWSEFGQRPWLDNLTRGYLRDGTLVRLWRNGVRGVTANPTIFARAIEGSSDYDDQFADLIGQGRIISDAYWELVIGDVKEALAVLWPLFDASGGCDGFVSVEIAPELARDTAGTVAAAGDLHRRISEPNLMVKIPATAADVDDLIGPDTANTLPESTIAAFEDHGTLARTLGGAGMAEAADVLHRLGGVGVDMDDVGLALEEQGIAGFHASFEDALAALSAKAADISR